MARPAIPTFRLWATIRLQATGSMDCFWVPQHNNCSNRVALSTQQKAPRVNERVIPPSYTSSRATRTRPGSRQSFEQSPAPSGVSNSLSHVSINNNTAHVWSVFADLESRLATLRALSTLLWFFIDNPVRHPGDQATRIS